MHSSFYFNLFYIRVSSLTRLIGWVSSNIIHTHPVYHTQKQLHLCSHMPATCSMHTCVPMTFLCWANQCTQACTHIAATLLGACVSAQTPSASFPSWHQDLLAQMYTRIPIPIHLASQPVSQPDTAAEVLSKRVWMLQCFCMCCSITLWVQYELTYPEVDMEGICNDKCTSSSAS